MTDAETNPKRRAGGPVEAMPLALSAVSAVLLLGGVLFALATASSDTTGTADRFRLLGQAANPFIAFLALTASALVLIDRRRPTESRATIAAGAALGVATAVSLAVVLLALNGVITDLSGDTTVLFRLSAIVSRLATLILGGVSLWIAVASGPARP